MLMDEPTPLAPLDVQAFAQAIHKRMQKRDQIPLQDVVAILRELKLTPGARATGPAPCLRIRRLRFRGTKTLDNEQPKPFIYDQVFADGVNVLLIEDNNVGKSSILKTIAFALTGDRSNYDKDVRGWIEDVWLTFAVGGTNFTIAITSGEGIRAVLAPSETDDAVDAIVARGGFVFFADSETALSSELQRFFFQQLRLVELSWVTATTGAGPVEAHTSWRTYFQPVLFDDSSHSYLLCDPEHNFGNQEGLIFSAYLGLSYAEAMNQLGVEKSRKTRDEKLTEEEAKKLSATIATQKDLLGKLRAEVRAIDDAVAARQRIFRGSPLAEQLLAAQQEITECSAERREVEEQRNAIQRELNRARSRLLRLEEAAEMRLHLSGIEVTLCPNCEHDIAQEAIELEATTHHCRLCGKTAKGADDAMVARLVAEKAHIGEFINAREKARSDLSTRIAANSRDIARLAGRSREIQEAVTRGVTEAFPSPEEQARRETLLEQIGAARAAIRGAEERLEGRSSEREALALRTYVLGKIREALAEEAERRNARLLHRLAEIMQTFMKRIGTESIGEVTCSPLGVVQLRKHGKPVKFTGIKNPGERVRVKLAFFLALAELGREPNGSRHPGLLLIDQPGTAEMVPEDFRSLAGLLRGVDRDSAADMQILCFTARSEFREATDTKKVYGPQSGINAF
jgi:hypothetical protein